MKSAKLSAIILVSIFLCSAFAAGVQADVLLTKHNLSVSGPGTIKATDEEQVCIFCHIPHHASNVAPLWSRESSTAIYNLYGSSSLVAQPGQPTGSSRLCLSCHDGTIAVGMLEGQSQPIPMAGGITTIPAGPTNLETDLSDDHPISFAYTSALATQRGELVDPLSLPAEIKLEGGQWLQCSSCHDAHKNPYGDFLVMDNTASALCLACHQQDGWPNSTHSEDVAVASEACKACHQSHGAPGKKHLLQHIAEEDNCLANCHNTAGLRSNVETEITKIYRHPVEQTAGIHDVTEDPLTMEKHVECQDCHNPHMVNGLNKPLADPPNISGHLQGVKGIDSSGVVLETATREYEVCFGCHADNAFYNSTNQVIRVIQEPNLRLRFDSNNPSYHPVVAVGVNPDVPSLDPSYTSYTEASLIYCTDCHGSDSSVKAGGTGANGPHGSIYPHILLDRYEQDIYPLAYIQDYYALCWRCHDPSALFDPLVSSFGNSHRSHVQTQGTPCSACHDPHGVPVLGGATTTGNAHLINFDTRFSDPAIVAPVYDSVAKSCTVSCHSNVGQGYTRSYTSP
jgi:predicted CXXCH cytochrome family protein